MDMVLLLCLLLVADAGYDLSNDDGEDSEATHKVSKIENSVCQLKSRLRMLLENTEGL